MPALTTDALYLHVDGMRGGKITSLQDRRSGRQWLLPPEAPTVDACQFDGPSGEVALPDHGEAWSRLHDPDGGSLALRVDPTVVPYLGIWWDSGMHSPVRVAALEPSTGYYDGLARAAVAERAPWSSPDSELRWDLEVALDADR